MKNTLFKKGLVIGIIVLFIGIGIVPSYGFQIDNKPVILSNRGNTLYVGGSGPNNYTLIQDAIDNAVDGDTVFVYDDSSPYYGNIVIDKSISLIGEDKDSTIIDGGGYGHVVNVKEYDDGVTISGFTIQKGETGISLNGKNNVVSGNIISDNNQGEGVYIFGCDNTVINNHIVNNYVGVSCTNANNNNIIKNNLINNVHQAAITQWDTIFNRNYWDSNYWIDYFLNGILPKFIVGIGFFTFGAGGLIFHLPYLYIEVDWHPAKQPYDIPDTSFIEGCGIE